MGKASKATKKFKAKHLKHTLEHRKEVKKHNQMLIKHNGTKKSGSKPVVENPKKDEIFKDMNVEEFFEGGFEVPKGKKKQASEIESESDESDEEILDHQQDLEKLAEKDPEFYKYLKENDQDLLDFNPTNPLDAMSDDDEEEEDEEIEEEEKPSKQVQNETKKVDVTRKLVREWSKKLDDPSITSIKTVFIAFKAAININQDQVDYKYTITDSDAFQDLILLVLKKIPIAISKILPYKVVKGSRTVPNDNSKLKQLTPLLKSHIGNLLTLLNDITNTDTAVLVLSSVNDLLPFFLSYRRLLKQLIISIVNIWSTTNDVETQIAAFAFLNNSSKEFQKSILENVLKQTYTCFIKKSRETNIHTMPMINFQKNSAAELFNTDPNLSYQIGFDYIRQLAIHLRNSINNTKDGYKTIYNWQYAHSLDFWSRVLSVQCNSTKNENQLKQLIYPLVQVTLGAIRLVPTAQFFPYRFYLIKSLIRISQNTGVFIPLFPLLQEILNSTTLTKNPKNTNLQAFDFDNNIKASANYLNTRTYQQGVCEQFIYLAGEYFVLYSKSISFPELVTPVTISLRRYIKQNKNVKFNKQLSNLVEKLNQNSEFIQQKRANVEFSPVNRAEVNKFLIDLEWEKTPFGAYIVVQREVKEEQDKILRESLLEDEKNSKNADKDGDIKLGESDDSEESEEADSEEEGSEDEE